MKRIFLSKWTKVLLFLLCLTPALNLGWRVWKQDLSPNPVEFIEHYLGDWTIRFVMITLTVTPLRGLLNQPQLTRFRRMLGLFTFFYGVLHFSTWLWLDNNFQWADMWKDILKRRYITVGMLALVLMVPLAVTSTAGWVRRLGFRGWQRLHRLVYITALAGVIHYYWLVKSDVRKPLMYGAILMVLMGYRAAVWLKKRPQAGTPAPRAVEQEAQHRGAG
jgi:methionine sulfoxide reductase heme-binding subunit